MSRAPKPPQAGLHDQHGPDDGAPEWVAWVAASRDGDHGAFERLYRAHRRLVMSLALRTLSHAAAEDVTQEVFSRAWARLHTLDEDRAFVGWLARIGRHLIVDHARARARRRDHHAAAEREAALPGGPGVHAEATPMDDAVFVLERIRALPDAYVEPMLLRLVGGYGAKDIAALVDRPPASVRVTLHRGMALLREGLKEAAP